MELLAGIALVALIVVTALRWRITLKNRE